MNQLWTLVQGDFRQILRDQTLSTFLLIPVLLVVLVRIFIPLLTEQFPEIAPLHPYIMMGAAIQTATMFGFITSFIFLEEKDENVLQVIRILPIAPFYFVVYRLFFATIISFTGALLMILYSGIAYPGLMEGVLISIQYGLTAPFIILIVATFAKNKVEGMAYFKGVNLILMLPLLSFFFPVFWKYLFSIIPTFWTFSLYESSFKAGFTGWSFFGGLLIYLFYIALLFFQFRKRVFGR